MGRSRAEGDDVQMKTKVVIIATLVVGIVVSTVLWLGNKDSAACDEWQDLWRSFLERAGGRPELVTKIQARRPEGCSYPSAVQHQYEVEGLFSAEAAYVAAILHLQEIGDLENGPEVLIHRDLSKTNDGPVLSEEAQELLRSELDPLKVTFVRSAPDFVDETDLEATYIGIVAKTEKPDGAEDAFELETVWGSLQSYVYAVAVDVNGGVATILQFDQIGVS